MTRKKINANETEHKNRTKNFKYINKHSKTNHYQQSKQRNKQTIQKAIKENNKTRKRNKTNTGRKQTERKTRQLITEAEIKQKAKL